MRYKVMVVDDEPLIRFGLVSCIDWEVEGFELIGEAANGASALRMLDDRHVDILITDIKMPLMDGLELSRNVKQINPNVKVIVVTSYSDFSYAQEAVRLGVVMDYILKPTMEPEDLLRIVRACKQHLDIEYAKHGDVVTEVEDGLPIQLGGLGVSLEHEDGAHAIQLAVLYIKENYCNELTLQEVADHVHMSKNYFSEQFKRFTGLNFIEFIIRLRISHAKHLLKTTNLKIHDVGIQSGFNTPKHFLKIFKREVKCTPTEYRQKQGRKRSSIVQRKDSKR